MAGVYPVRAVTRLAASEFRPTSYREDDMDRLASPGGRRVPFFFTLLAKQENSTGSQRARSGMETTRTNGIRMGRPPGSRVNRKRMRRFCLVPFGG